MKTHIDPILKRDYTRLLPTEKLEFLLALKKVPNPKKLLFNVAINSKDKSIDATYLEDLTRFFEPKYLEGALINGLIADVRNAFKGFLKENNGVYEFAEIKKSKLINVLNKYNSPQLVENFQKTFGKQDKISNKDFIAWTQSLISLNPRAGLESENNIISLFGCRKIEKLNYNDDFKTTLKKHYFKIKKRRKPLKETFIHQAFKDFQRKEDEPNLKEKEPTLKQKESNQNQAFYNTESNEEAPNLRQKEPNQNQAFYNEEAIYADTSDPQAIYVKPEDPDYSKTPNEYMEGGTYDEKIKVSTSDKSEHVKTKAKTILKEKNDLEEIAKNLKSKDKFSFPNIKKILKFLLIGEQPQPAAKNEAKKRKEKTSRRTL